MKNLKFLLFTLVTLSLASCFSRVAPNSQGVLMEDYGQNGKSDYSLVKGRVSTFGLGKELFQVPLFVQRGDMTRMELKASNNTLFYSTPKYSYKAIPDRCIDIAFEGSRLDSNGEEMLDGIEDNILEPIIDDLTRELLRTYHTDSLMAEGGSLKFEKDLEVKVAKFFESKGFKLETFQAQLELTDKVKRKIDMRNEVNTNLSVLDSEIKQKTKEIELAKLDRQKKLIESQGLTNQILIKEFIDKWDGKSSLYGDNPLTLLKEVK